jgi:hypothetical protein
MPSIVLAYTTYYVKCKVCRPYRDMRRLECQFDKLVSQVPTVPVTLVIISGRCSDKALPKQLTLATFAISLRSQSFVLTEE